MASKYNKLKNATRLFVDEALDAVRAGFEQDDKPLRSLEITQLEQRLLMSASPAAAVAELAEAAQATAEPDVATPENSAADFNSQAQESDGTYGNTEQARVELVVIDPSAENHEQLVADLQSQEDRLFEILVLNPREDGIAQITDALQDMRDVSAIHLVSHGEDGEVLLGATVLSKDTVQRYAAEMVTWQQSLTADADLLIYGCDLAASEDGIELTNSLNVLLGTDIAASDDDTGAAVFGGDWQLEHHVGEVETDVAFTSQLQDSWMGLLNVTVDNTSVGTAGAGSSSDTNSHTTNGTDRLMLVGISFGQDNGDSVDSVTYNGTNLTMVRVHENGNNARVEIWQLTAPDVGTHDVVVNFSGTSHDGATIGITTFIGADQTDALVNASGNHANSSTASVTFDAFDADNVFGVVAFDDTNNLDLVPGTEQTELWDANRASANGGGSLQDATGTTTTTEWTVPANTNWAAAAVGIRSSGGIQGPLSPSGETAGDTTSAGVQTTASENRNSPQAIAMDAFGNRVVVWSDSVADGDGWGVFAQRYDASGNAVGSRIDVNSHTTNDQHRAAVAMDASGRFAVTWTSSGQDGDGQGVYVRRFNADGSAIDTNDVRVSDTATGNQKNSSIAANASGDFVVTWQVDSSDIFVKQFGITETVTGGVLGNSDILVNNGANQNNPDVDINNAGKFVVVWQDGNKPHAMRYAADGSQRGSKISLNPLNFFNGPEEDPTVAVLSNGDFVVAYRSNIGGFEGVWLRPVSDDGTVGSVTKASSDDAASNPSITKDANDNILVAYQSPGDGDGQGVFGRKYDSNLSAIGGEFLLTETTAGDQENVSIAMLDIHNYAVVWSGDGAGGATGVFSSSTGTSATPSNALTAVKDTYIHKNNAAENYGNTSLNVDKSGGSVGNGRALVEFDVSAIPTNAVITDAVLRMPAIGGTGAFNIGAYQLTESWDEGDGTAGSGATWTNRTNGAAWNTDGGDFDATAVDTIAASTTGNNDLDITSLVQDWVNGSSANYGVLLGSEDGGGEDITFHSSETGVGPQLLVFWELPSGATPTTTASDQVVNPATIDGVIDSAWDGAAWNTLNNTIGTIDDANDLSAQWKSTWDSENLYILVDVTDDSLRNNSAQASMDDSVEIYIDADNSKGTSFDGVNDFEWAFRYNDPGTVHLGGNSVPDTTGINFELVANGAGTGYVLEVAVPWTTLGVTPAIDGQVGIEVQVNDDDNGGDTEGRLTWDDAADQAFFNPSTFGIMSLNAVDTSTITVDTTGDNLDGDTSSIAALYANKGADGAISLREAITAANNTTNGTGVTDRIEFNISAPLVNGAHTIDVASALPLISEAIIIDGTTDPDFAGSPIIVLNGTSAGTNVDGLVLVAGSDGSTVQGLSVGGFSGSGILLSGSSSHTVQGNYLGVNATGTQAFGNSLNGLRLNNSDNNQIGGTTVADRNLFGGNADEGMRITSSDGNTIVGNYFGLAATGSATVGNSNDGLGIYGDSSGNQIGGAGAGQANVFAGNANNGIEIGATANNNLIQGNFIGVAADGTAFGNSTTGVRIHSNASSNTIGGTGTGEGNVIASNGQSGVSTAGSAADNLIIGNSIHSHSGQGIDVNHNGTVDTQTAMPVLTLATVNGTDLHVEGTITGNVGEVYTIALYSTDSPDANGYGEGRNFLDDFSVTITATGVSQAFAFDLAGAGVPVGDAVTATASSASGQTTEFAANVTAAATNQAPTAAIAALNSIREGDDLFLDARPSTDPNGDTLSFEWSLDGDTVYGEANEPTTETATVNWATLQTLGITGPGTYTIRLKVDDGNGGVDETSTDLVVTPPLGADASLWFSTGDVNNSGNSGLGSWSAGELVELGNPNLTFGTNTDGSLGSIIDFDNWGDDGNVDVEAFHYVTANITIGGTDSTTLQVGDILFATAASESFNGGAFTALDEDILLFRPTTAGDYSTGTVSRVLSGLNASVGLSDLTSLTLVEQTTTFGDVQLDRGDFLVTQSTDDTTILLFRTGNTGDGTTTGTLETLVDATEVGVSRGITGLEFVERSVTLGGVTLNEGQLLVSVGGNNGGIGTSGISVTRSDVLALTFSQTTAGSGVGNSIANSATLVDGSDISLQSGSEALDGLSLAGFEVNSAPEGTLAPLPTIREGEGISVDATDFADPDGETLTLEWDINYNGTFSADRTGPSASLDWSELSALGINDDGTYSIAFRVSDGVNAPSIITQTLTVNNVRATLTVTGPTEVRVGETFTLNLSAADPGDDTHTWTVNWGDGTTSTVNGNVATATHSYQNGGFTNNITVSAVDEDGQTASPSALFVTGSGSNSLYRSDQSSSGTITTFGAPVDVVTGPDGFLYTLHRDTASVSRFDAAGNFVETFSLGSTGGLNQPTNMAFGPDGNLYVTSSASNQVLIIGNDGRFLGEFANGLDAPTGIAFDPSGNLYVSNSATGDILKFDGRTGLQIGTGPFASFGRVTASDLEFRADGHLFASSSADNVIREFDVDGNFVSDFGGGPLANITQPGAFTKGPDGRVYVTDIASGNVAIYAADGTFDEMINTGLTSPAGITFASSLQVKVNSPPTVSGESYTVDEGAALNVTASTDWFNESWKNRQQIAFDNSASASNLTDFRVLVKLHASAADAVNIDYSLTKAGGQDLRFVDPDGTLLDHEIEAWDAAGYSYVWVEVPQIDALSASDSITMYYNHPDAVDGSDQEAVWETEYGLVSHANLSSRDSSANNNTGTVSNVVVTNGIVGGAGTFNGTDSFVNFGSDASIDDVFAGGGTISAWINPAGWGENGYGRILDKADGTFNGSGANGWAFQVGDSGGNGYLLFEHGFSGNRGAWRTPAGSITLGTWQQVALVYDNADPSNQPQIYIDGVLQTLTQTHNPSGTATSDAANNLVQGNFSQATTRTFDGAMDEVRVQRGTVSAEQIAAEYQTVTGNFVSSSAAESGPSGLLSNDSDRDGDDLTVSLVSGPASDPAFTLNADGSFDYQHDGSETTSDSFSYRVTDEAGNEEIVTVSLTINPVNDAPEIQAINNQTVTEGTSSAVAVEVSDADHAVGDITVAATSGDQSLITNASLVVTGLGASRTLALTPVAGANGGPVTITVTATDALGAPTTTTFDVTVLAVDDPPTITPLSSLVNLTSPEDTVSAPLTFRLADVDTPVTALTLTASSNDQSIIRDADITVTGTGADRVVTFTPVADATGGPVTITLTASDGASDVTTSFDVTITPVNDAPTVSQIVDQIVSEDTPSGQLAFTLTDTDNAFGDLVVTATSSDQTIIADSAISVGGTGANRFVEFTPELNQYGGPVQITVTVSDGTDSTDMTFAVTVSPVNDAPTVSQVADQTVAEDTPSAALAFTIDDVDNATGDLTVTASSSDQTLITDAAISISGTGANRVIEFTPEPNQNGSATITVSVSDGNVTTEMTFDVTVTPVNDAPTVSQIADQTVLEDTSSGRLAFIIDDVDDLYRDLTITATSDNQTLISDGAFSITGFGANRFVEFTPELNQHGGPAQITVSVSDGSAATEMTFNVVVDPVNDAPEVSPIANITVAEDGVVAPISLAISDVDSAAADFEITATSSDRTIIRNRDITIGGTPSAPTLQMALRPDAFGLTTITVFVSDGTTTSSQEFDVEVTPVNDAPVIVHGSSVVVDEDTPSGPILFQVMDTETASSDLIVTVTTDTPGLIDPATLEATGTGVNRAVRFEPVENQHGTGSITISTSDGHIVTSKTIAVVVNSVNDAPEMISGQSHHYELIGAAKLIVSAPELLNGGSDQEGDSIQAVLDSGPAHGTLTLHPDGGFVYIPAEGVFGTETFTYRLSDGQSASDPISVTIDVLPVTTGDPAPSPSSGSDSGTDSGESDTPAVEETTETSESGSESESVTESVMANEAVLVGRPDDAESEEAAGVFLLQSSNDSDDSDAIGAFLAITTSTADGGDAFNNLTSISVAESERVNATSLQQNTFGRQSQLTDFLYQSSTSSPELVQQLTFANFAELKGTADQIDSLREDLESEYGFKAITTNGVAIAGTTIAVGSVVTALRTGMLALGFLSQLPVWTFFDPLMVVDGVAGDEGDSLEDIVDRQTEATGQADDELEK